MPKSTNTCNKVIDLMYSALPWASVAQNNSASPFTSVYLSLHSSSPTAAANSQLENEVAYTNYARKTTTRSAADWSAASGGATANVQLQQFPQCGVTGATGQSVSTGTGATGAGNVWHYGALNASIAIANGITPQFAQGALVIQET